MATAAVKTTVRTAAERSAAAEPPLDTRVRLVTPERIIFEHPLAGPFHRFSAYLIDFALWLVLVIVATILSLVLALGSISGVGLALVAYFVLTWGYGAVCEGLFNGQTLGKRLLGIRVVSDRGVPITGMQAVVRNLVGVVDGFLPFGFMLGLSSMVLTRKCQRLGDLAAGTMVVIEQRRRPLKLERVGGPEVEMLLPWLPLRIPAGPELARALSDYVRSRVRVGPRRREELAENLAPVFRRRYRLPATASSDAILCAIYHRVFLGGVTAVALRVVDRLAAREASWRELDALLDDLAGRRGRRVNALQVLRLGELYRAACTDLMLAESHHLPREAVGYLHALVGRAHNALYRAQGFKFSDWATHLFGTVPRQLRGDPALRLAAVVFWGAFLLCGLLAAGRADFAPRVAGAAMLDQMDEMYAEPIGSARKETGGRNDTAMAGFYIQHNASIGLQCFAWGLFFGLGSLFELLSNGILLGTVFGAMARGPHAANFFTFVTAHGPFELTAIVFSGAAGLRLGSGLIDTQGQTRLASLRREAARALPVVAAAVLLFVLAAFLEGFISASQLPYTAKAAIAGFTALLLAGYLALGGRHGDRIPKPKSEIRNKLEIPAQKTQNSSQWPGA